MRVLLTGGAGFIGTHLARALLDRRHEVSSLDIAEPRVPVPGVTYLGGDVREPRTLPFEGIDLVFHLAAIASVPLCERDPEGSHDTNLTGTFHVLRACADSGAAFALASSAAVYGDGCPADAASSETSSPRPRSLYAAQKLASEEYARAFHAARGVKALCLRFFNVYGPGQNPESSYTGVISAFLAAVGEGRALRIDGGGTQTRDFVHVRDVARACAAAAERIEAGMREAGSTVFDGSAINIGSGNRISIRELSRLVREASGSEAEEREAPAREGDVAHSLAEIGRARALLGWRPEVELRAGIGELLHQGK